MSYSLSESLADHEATMKSLRLAAAAYPSAHHVTGRVWEVAALPEANDVLVTADGVYPCIWVGATDGHEGAVCIRERTYSLGPESFLRMLAHDDPEWRARLLKAARR